MENLGDSNPKAGEGMKIPSLFIVEFERLAHAPREPNLILLIVCTKIFLNLVQSANRLSSQKVVIYSYSQG